MEDSQKREILQSRRGPLENEKYSAEVDLAVAEKSGDVALEEEPRARLERVNSQLAVLEEKEDEVGRE